MKYWYKKHKLLLDPKSIATSTCISHSSQSPAKSCDYCLLHGSGDMRRSHIPCFLPACAAARSLVCGRKEDERRQKMNALGRKATSSLGYNMNVTRLGRRNDKSMRTKTAESDSFVRSFVRRSFVGCSAFAAATVNLFEQLCWKKKQGRWQRQKAARRMRFQLVVLCCGSFWFRQLFVALLESLRGRSGAFEA